MLLTAPARARAHDEFLDLVLADEELLRAEFDAIVTAASLEPPGDPPAAHVGGDDADRDQRVRGTFQESRAPSRKTRPPARARLHERSPPLHRNDHTRGR